MTSKTSAKATSSSSSTAVMDEAGGGRNNTLVAESDLEAAYEAMEARMQRSIAKYTASKKAGNNQNHVEVARSLLQECGNSLQRHVQRIVQPISDEAFHVYNFKQQQQPNEEESITENDKSNNNDDNVDDEEDVEYDEEDLLDPEALQRVKELRDQVRAQAARVQEIRGAALEQAVSLGQRQVRLWLGTSAEEEAAKKDNEQEQRDDANNNNISSELAAAAATEQLQTMQESLTTMTAALDHVQQQHVPDKLKTLQETIAVIEQNLHKVESGTLSQTEQAILHRNNHQDEMDCGDGNDDSDNMTPEKRLANFLGTN